MKIGIIGGGPAGMMAALQARHAGAQVLLMDANPAIGRKLAATGSGRGNLSNRQATADKYFCDAPRVLETIFSQFGHIQLLRWLEQHSIFTYTTEDGWTYPVSNLAANVVDILTAHLIQSGVEIISQTLITDIQKVGGGFHLYTADTRRSFAVDRVVVATGGPAYPQLGARDTINAILMKLDHSILPVLPALAPLVTEAGPFHKLQGVRLDAGVSLLAEGKEIGRTFGNIIFTTWGLNGPGVMDLNHLVNLHSSSKLTLYLDLTGGHSAEIDRLINDSRNISMPMIVLLESILPVKLARFILEQSRLKPDISVGECSNKELNAVKEALTHQAVQVKGSKGFKESQLSTGGVPLKEVNAESLESGKCRGLYLAGEVLNVIGPCGGFNLQWAFSSGYVAGKHSVAD